MNWKVGDIFSFYRHSAFKYQITNIISVDNAHISMCFTLVWAADPNDQRWIGHIWEGIYHLSNLFPAEGYKIKSANKPHRLTQIFK